MLKGSLEIIDDLQIIDGYTYVNPASKDIDTVDDIRFYASGGNMVFEKCKTGGASKGAGVWEGINIMSYGQMILSAPATVTLTGSYVKIEDTFTDNNLSKNFILDVVNSQLQYKGTGSTVVLFVGTSDVSIDTADVIYYGLFINGNLVGETTHTFAHSAKTDTIAITQLIELQPDDIIDVRAKCENTTKDLTISSLNVTFWGGGFSNIGTGGATKFTDLTDVPANYTGQANKVVSVKADESGLEFTTAGAGSGDVVGPAGATADDIAVFDGATGKKIKDGGKKISDLALSGHTHTIAQVDPTGSSAGTPIDTDYLSFWQGAYTWFKITFANLKAYFKAYFDIYYQKYSGFENRTESSIAIDSGTGVFTLDVLAPATSFNVWTNGSKWNYTTPQTVTITDDQTITYVYVDIDGILKKATSPWSLTGDAAPCAIVFKDGSSYAVTDERHSYNRNKQWHNWAHFNIGAMYRSGLTGTFTDTTLSIIQGVVADEDIEFDTGGTKTTCSLWYRNATTGMRLIRSSSTPYRAVAGALKYDNGSGTLQDVSLNRYSTQWVYVSHDDTEAVYVVIGQNNSVNLTDARNAAYPTINLSTAEWKLIYRVIYRNAGGTPTYIEAADFRTVQTGVPTTATTSDHAALINRDAASSHPDTAINITETYAGNIVGTTNQKEVNDVVDSLAPTETQIEAIIQSAATGTPIGSSLIPFSDEVNNLLKTISLTDFEAVLKAYFDTLYGGSPGALRATISEYFNDFCGMYNALYATSPTTLDSSEIFFEKSGTASILWHYASEASHQGVITLDIGTGAGAYVYFAVANTTFFYSGGEIIFETLMKIPTLSDGTNRYSIIVGLQSTYGTWMEYTDNVNSGKWVIKCKNVAGTTTVNTNEAPVAGTWYRIKVVINADATSVSFYINDVEVTNSPVTTNIPSGLTSSGILIMSRTSGSTARNILADYVYWKKTFTTPR